jgi:hypothetical protein
MGRTWYRKHESRYLYVITSSILDGLVDIQMIICREAGASLAASRSQSFVMSKKPLKIKHSSPESAYFLSLGIMYLLW